MTQTERCFIWLGGASPETLILCGTYERMKYAALGATLLVPAVAGLLAGYYTIYSLVPSTLLAGTIALFWALALVVIDRAILVTYRKGQRQLPSVFLRMAIAGLAGILIAHMIVLFVFRDQIDGKIDEHRQQSIAQLTQSAQAQIRLAREAEESRNAPAIAAKKEQIAALLADKNDHVALYRRRDVMLRNKDQQIALAYRELDQLHERQSYDEAKRVEARLAEDVEAQRSRRYDDILSRTAALHDVVWQRASAGDWSALAAYVLLVLLLFTLDTLPIAVKVLLPMDTYERVLTRSLVDIENRIMLEAEERWQALQADSRHRVQNYRLLSPELAEGPSPELVEGRYHAADAKAMQPQVVLAQQQDQQANGNVTKGTHEYRSTQ